MLALGPVELAGHLPLIGIAVLFLVRGSGSLRAAQRAEPEPAAPSDPGG